ncbi:MAG TPA: phosphodiester glycosidase family protein [Candidatus Krumholzibacteria bacterium]|nr:phosphodiester glycosidase family protein [Candidatus Krumholzibacteria bacterium]
MDTETRRRARGSLGARGSLAFLIVCAVGFAAPAAAQWRELAPGLDLAEFPAEEGGPSAIRVVRADPVRWEPVLLCASAPGQGTLRSTGEWCEAEGLAAAVNASMYQKDYLTSTAHLRHDGHVNNSYVSKDNTVLLFDPLDDADPPLTLLDRTCEDLDAAAARYRTAVQGIRMVSCRGNNVWSPQDRRASVACLGVDGAGRLLLIHCRAELSVHDLTARLLALPLDLRRCQYAEGGKQAQLSVRAGGVSEDWTGRMRGIFGQDVSVSGWPVPNVVGIRAR